MADAGTPQRQASWAEIERETTNLLAAANDAGLTLRVVGSTGIRMHCPAGAETMDRAGREPKDIDLIGRSRQRRALRGMFEDAGYELDRDVLVAMEGSRFCLTHPGTGIDVDLFFDRLDFCHKVELEERIDLVDTTIPLEELLLQKLQVHELTDNDALDAAVLLAVHEIGDGQAGGEQIDAGLVSALLARDWGFHRTATENLERIGREAAQGGPSGLDAEAAQRVARGVGVLREAIQSARKSRSWRLRARVGERMQWWNDVNERELSY